MGLLEGARLGVPPSSSVSIPFMIPCTSFMFSDPQSMIFAVSKPREVRISVRNTSPHTRTEYSVPSQVRHNWPWLVTLIVAECGWWVG
jgi:hypothetical protein